jgi:hypothetical protein
VTCASRRTSHRAPSLSRCLAAFALLAGGCGDSDDASSATAATATTDSTSADPTATAGSTATATVTTSGSSETASASSGSTATTAEPTTTGDTDGPRPARVVVTADWRSGSLSVLDEAALLAGATTREAALWKTIDVSAYAPGPLEVELTPDGATAVVAISPGFFDGFVGGLAGLDPNVPAGGGLLFVDLDTSVVTPVELCPPPGPCQVPMGIAISPDGQRVFTADYGTAAARGRTVTVVDRALDTVEVVDVGSGPEQIDLSADGTLGIVNLAGDGAVVVFQTADVAGTLSAPVAIGDDPSGVLFLDGTSLAVVANSQGEPEAVLLDVSDPAAPVVLDTWSDKTGLRFPYGVTRVPGQDRVLLPITNFESIVLVSLEVSPAGFGAATPRTVATTKAFPLNVVTDGTSVIVPAPGDARVGGDALLVGELAGTGPLTAIPWLAADGPTYVARQP